MAKDTPRDRVWSYSMMKALEGRSFKLKHVRNNVAKPPSDRTIRDVLNTMVEYGWLDKEKKQSNEWRPGQQAEKVELVSETDSVGPIF